jgi:hypothetical protein
MELSNLLTLGFFFCFLLLGVLLGMFNVWIPWNTVTKQSSDDARVQFSRDKGATDCIISHQMLSYEKDLTGFACFKKYLAEQRPVGGEKCAGSV